MRNDSVDPQSLAQQIREGRQVDYRKFDALRRRLLVISHRTEPPFISPFRPFLIVLFSPISPTEGCSSVVAMAAEGEVLCLLTTSDVQN